MSKNVKRILSIVAIILCVSLVSSIPAEALSGLSNSSEDATYSNFNDIKGDNEEIGNIVYENKSTRTEYTKEFVLDNGTTLLAQYNQPVHYKDSDGKWVDYDNSLAGEKASSINNESDSSNYINKSSNIKIKLSQKAKSNNMISLSSNDYNISWGYDNANKSKAIIKNNNEKLSGNEKFTTLNNLTSEAVYKDVFNSVDLQYFVSSSGVKENIILKSSTAQNEFELTYKINNLSAKQKDDYTIVLSDKKGNEVYAISAPYMYDADGNMSTQLKLEMISQKGANLKIKLTADYWFIHGLGRSFPITIDPELTTITKLSFNEAAKSGYLINHGPYYIGNDAFTTVKVNSLQPIEDGEKIINAKYNLNIRNGDVLFDNEDENEIIVKAHKITEYKVAVSYDSEVIDYDTLSYSDNSSLTFDITQLYNEWYSNGESVDGFVLEAWDTIGSKQVAINESNSAYPSLTLVYKNFTGMESNLSYHTIPVGFNAQASVSDYLGNLVITQNIYEGTGSRMPAHITATYNSVLHNKLFANGSPAGYGWQFSFNQYIKETDSTLQSAGYDYIYTDEDGTAHYFKKNTSSGTDEWEDEDNLGLTLTADENYVYIDNGEIVQKYDLPSNKGVLLSETDSNNNVITYSYNSLGNLTKITDGSGRIIKINYAYYSSNSEPRVSNIELPDGNIITFAYYANQLMACVGFPNNKSSWFSYTQYTSDGLLNKVEQRDYVDSDYVKEQKYGYTYNSSNQVKKITEYGSNGVSGNFLSFAYNDDNTTKITDRNGLSEIYTFDNYGKTVTILNANGYIENTRDSEDNSLSISGGSESYTRNYVEESREPSSKYFSKVDGAGSVGGQLSYDSSTETVNGENVQYLGSKSIRITNTGKTQFYTMAKHQYDDSNLFGKTLTFSSYVKTNNVTATSNASGVTGAFIKIECFDGNGNIIKEENSPGIVGSNGWQRISTTATIPANTDHFNIYCGIKDAQGTAWFDCLQLEKGNAMNDYNALQNSDFSTTDAWSNASANNIKQIEGNGTSDRFVYQYVNINKANVSFNISGEAKADSVPLSEEKRTFGIALKIFYEGDNANSNIETHYVPFNDATSLYQSIGATITPEQPNKVIETVAFSFVYQYNENIMYLKNAMLNIGDIAFDSTASDEGGNDPDTDDESDAEVTYPYDGSVSTYDSYGNTLSTKQGSVIKNSNDEEVIDTSKPFISTSSNYDSTGNYVTSEVDAAGNTVSYTVDASTGNPTKVTDANGNATNYSYDYVGTLTGISSGNTSNTYTYNSANSLSAISHNGFSYDFNYDVYNNLVSTVIGDTALVTNTYDSNNGNLTKTKYGNNQGLIYSYDNYGRITSISYFENNDESNAHQAASYIYNKKGLVIKSIENKSGQTTEYQYDCTGNLLRKNTTSDDGNTIAYSSGYDSSGNAAETLNINGNTRTVTSGTDDNHNSYIDNGDSKVTKYTDSLGRTESINMVDKSTNKRFEASYEYAAGAESGSTTELVSNYTQSYDGKTLANYDYTYDANGNITTIKENGKLIAKYTYDSLNQLKTEYDYVNKKYVVYSYDGNGNILAQHTQRLDPTYGYPSGKEYGNVFYYNDSEWKDKITGINHYNITYDEIGNPINYRDGMTMSWRSGRELAGVALENGTSITYTYNANGLRTCKNVGGTKTYYYYDDNNNLVVLTNDNATMFFYYDGNNSPASFSYNGTMYYYAKNLQGDIVKIINKNGVSCGTYTYDSWGNVISESGDSFVSELNPLRYRGYVYDTDTGLYYLQSRYYDPVTGRFINADAYCDTGTGSPLSTNLFTYCENNAVKYVDIYGYKTTISAWHFKYNRTKAVNYAKKWWNSRNNQYYSYGQDCTNFVSQCLYAGGISMTLGGNSYSWHSFRYNKKGLNLLWWISNNFNYDWDVSEPWRLCNSNYKYFKSSVYAKKTITIKDTKKSVQSAAKTLKIGDPLYMDDNGDGVPNHAVIITKINKEKTKIYYAAHTDSHKEKNLEKYLTHKSGSKKKIYAIAIKDSF